MPRRGGILCFPKMHVQYFVKKPSYRASGLCTFSTFSFHQADVHRGPTKCQPHSRSSEDERLALGEHTL